MTLEDVRDEARKNLKGICGVFKICDGAPGKTCQNQSYGASIGLGGVGSGASFAANVSALAAVKLRMRVVGPHFEPDIRYRFFGTALSMPVLGASVSGVKSFGEAMTEEAFCQATVAGCADAGSLAFRGDTFSYSEEVTPGIDAIAAAGGRGVKIFKPRSQDVLFRLIEKAEAAGCVAVGMDVDGCGSTIMAKHGKPVFRKSAEDIARLCNATKLPFIVKGVMTVGDAEAAAQAGAAAVVVSNHGGRVLDATPGTAAVLPAIAQALEGRIPVLVDGGVRTGFDVLKMLALGASAVLVGRDLIRAAVGGGPEGVRLQLEHLAGTLKRAMVMTGCHSLGAVTPQIIESVC